ncbi:MAG: PAS domain-containing protein [Elusimicrobia bacterium]|nr:PAS domain-containing protein [Elusimicrobiota bacterium]
MEIKIISLPTFIAFLFNVYVLMLILTQDYRKRISRIFSMLVISCIIWDIFEFALRNTGSPGNGLLFAKITWTGVAFIAPIFLNFALLFPKERKILKNKLIYAFIYLPAFVVIYFTWFSKLFITDTQPLLLDGARTIIYGPFLNIYAFYAYPIFLGILWLFYDAWKNSQSKREKLQGKWMFFASLLPITGGLITNIFLPSIGIKVLPLATSFTVIMSMMIVNAITKYRIMAVTPNIAAETIISMLPNIIILLGTDQKILYANRNLLDLLGYTKEELLGQNVKKILHEDDRVFGIAWQTINEKRSFEKSKIKFLSKDRSSIPFYFCGAVATDGDDVIGFIGIGTVIENGK